MQIICQLYYSAVQSSKCATSSDPTGAMRSPMTMWPTAPWSHTTQTLYPWGCEMYGHVGKTTKDPNNAPRARPGMFVGFSKTTSGYLIYHFDTGAVQTYAYVTAIPNRFPCRERQLTGERENTLTDGDWRR